MIFLKKLTRSWLSAGLWSVTAAGLFLSAGCQKEEQVGETTAEIPRNVRIVVVEPRQVTEYLEVSGPVAPWQGANLSAQESGPVVRLAAAKGEQVHKGDIIIEQDRGILAAQMKSAQALLKTQSYNVDKVRKLNAAGKVSEMELLTAESRYEEALAQASVNRERFERAAIKAPFDGVIVDRFVELGQMVQPGQPVVRLIDPTKLKLEAYLTDQEVPWVRTGSQAQVELEGQKTSVPAQVSWVAVEADRQTGKFKMELEIPNSEGLLRSGVIGRARIQKSILPGVLVIPRNAVLFANHGTSVFVVKTEGGATRAYRRQVVLGTDQGTLVVVKKGLQPGDHLVVRGHRALRDSSLVRITETATRQDGLLPGDPDFLAESSGAVVAVERDNR